MLQVLIHIYIAVTAFLLYYHMCTCKFICLCTYMCKHTEKTCSVDDSTELLYTQHQCKKLHAGKVFYWWNLQATANQLNSSIFIFPSSCKPTSSLCFFGHITWRSCITLRSNLCSFSNSLFSLTSFLASSFCS